MDSLEEKNNKQKGTVFVERPSSVGHYLWAYNCKGQGLSEEVEIPHPL